jgi:formate dehydrogenase subunit gamma
MHRPADRLPRFTRAERQVHRWTAALVGVLALTGFALSYEPLVLIVGRRPLVEGLHVAAGLALPVPILVGLLRSPALRLDVASLNRFVTDDWAWLRRRDRPVARRAVGKFNAGQKVAAAFVAGAGSVLLLTGLLLLAPVWFDVPVGLRQGATVTHDLFTFGLLALLAGHIWMAMRRPEARTALRTGFVSRSYAEQHHPAWAASHPAAGGVAGEPLRQPHGDD